MNKKEFQKMWEAGPIGVYGSEVSIVIFTPENKVKDKAGVIEKDALIFSKGVEGVQFYYTEEGMSNASKYGYKKFNDHKKTLEYLINAEKALRKTDRSYKRNLKQNYQKMSVDELLSENERATNTYINVYTYFMACQPQYFSLVEKKLQEYLLEKIPEGKLSDICTVLISSNKLDPIRKEELEWYEVVKKAQSLFDKNRKLKLFDLKKEKALYKTFKEHVDKYIHVGRIEAFIDWDEKHYLNLLNKQINENIEEKIKNISRNKKELGKTRAEYINKYKIDKKITTLASDIAEIGRIRFYLRFGWTKASYIFIKVKEEILARKVQPFLTFENIWDYSRKEFQKAIKNNEKINDQELKNREKAFLFEVKDGKMKFYSGDEAIKRKERLAPEEKLDIKELKGSIACKGKAAGEVTVLSWAEEDINKKMRNMKKGNILVAGQTRPFLMPAIRKAGAIVTDEGGMTSHAAIISREFNKPCIIGTKIATQVLKDGDIVEVDANKGIIRKIK